MKCFISLQFASFVLIHKQSNLVEVCIPKCHFLQTGFFQKFPVPSIWEHPLPGPDSVPAFGTGFFPFCFKLGNILEFPNASWMKINNFLVDKLDHMSQSTISSKTLYFAMDFKFFVVRIYCTSKHLISIKKNIYFGINSTFRMDTEI